MNLFKMLRWTFTLLLSSCLVCSFAMSLETQSQASRRKGDAYRLRQQSANRWNVEKLVEHPTNGDVNLPGHYNSFTKGLLHNNMGIVDEGAFKSLLTALESEDYADFEAIGPLGGGGTLLRNPMDAFKFSLEGRDSHNYTMPAAPAFSSAYQASDAAEVAWQAILRDIPFSDYSTHPLVSEAIDDLNNYSDYRGPGGTGNVTVQNIFRGQGPGELVGPYISQFLYLPFTYGASGKIDQKYISGIAGKDFLTNWDHYIDNQNGYQVSPSFITQPARYIVDGRGIAYYVSKDFNSQAYINAAFILNTFPNALSNTFTYSPGNPDRSQTMTRNPMFSLNHALDLVSRMATVSQDQAWYQKWLVHLRARPEVFFARVHSTMMKLANPASNWISFPVNQELLISPVLTKLYNANGTYLLPMAGRSGAPLHPTYPAGHSTMAGAGATILKAFFNTLDENDQPLPWPASVQPVIPDTTGGRLLPYTGNDLTIEGEINKLASNITLGRDFLGVHFRSDGDLGILLGEELAISILQDHINTFAEDITFKFCRFDGALAVIEKDISL